MVRPTFLVDGKPNGTDLTVPAQGALSLTIKADFPATGSYRSRITLVYDNHLWTIPLIVDHTSDTLSIVVSDIAAVRNTSTGSADVAVRVTVTENAGKVARLFEPSISSLVRTDEHKNKVQARYSGLMTTPRGDSNQVLTIGPHRCKTMTLTIQALEQSGEFNGVVSFSGPSANAISRPFTIYRREGWWVAAIFIFVGMAVAYAIRLYVRTLRPALLRQHQVEVVRADRNYVPQRERPGCDGAGGDSSAAEPVDRGLPERGYALGPNGRAHPSGP
jgi:hypothetical protein